MKHNYFVAIVCALLFSVTLKAQDGITLMAVDFHDGTRDGNFWGGTGYETGVVSTGSEAHGQTADYSFWRRIPNTETATLSALTSIYPRYSNYFGTANFVSYIRNHMSTDITSANNGFMMMSMYDQAELGTGNFNAYINLGVVDASSASVIDVRFYQFYQKYYDYCYIDYRTSSTGSWIPVEINKSGVDINVTSTYQGYCTYTLPLAAAGQSYLELRLRWFNSSTPQRGTAYGYMWLIDDVEVIASNPDRMKLGTESYTQGGYGTMPKYMNIEPAWSGDVTNHGANTQENVTATLKHMNSTMSSVTTLGSYNNGSVAASTTKRMILDPEGWFNTDSTSDWYGWYSLSNHNVHHGSCDPLPTQITGDHYLYTSITTDAGLNLNFDTMYYRVSSFDNNTKSYRWGKDNGMLSYRRNNYYIFGYYMQDGARYVSEDPDQVNFNNPEYSVNLRYSTGREVPEGWVIRGVELVASPIYSGVGSTIKPMLLKEEYNDGNTIDYIDLIPNSEAHLITANEVNDETVLGRNSNPYLEPDNYNTITMLFPEQPALQPFTSYRIGYKIVNGNNFAVAAAADYYSTANPRDPENFDTIIYFRNNPATEKYSHLFKPNDYDVLVLDTTGNNSYSQTRLYPVLNYNQNAPMIRMLVGPRQVGIGSVGSTKVSLYPNPATSQVTVSLAGASGTAQCAIFDICGREVWAGSWDAAQPKSIDLTKFSNGIYMLRTVVNGETTVQKLVVKN